MLSVLNKDFYDNAQWNSPPRQDFSVLIGDMKIQNLPKTFPLLYIPATSGHKKRTINNFILGELRRFLKNTSCTKNRDMQMFLETLTFHLFLQTEDSKNKNSLQTKIMS